MTPWNVSSRFPSAARHSAAHQKRPVNIRRETNGESNRFREYPRIGFRELVRIHSSASPKQTAAPRSRVSDGPRTVPRVVLGSPGTLSDALATGLGATILDLDARMPEDTVSRS